MKKEFIPYNEALALKELGFDEPCIAHYTSHGYYNSIKELKWKRPTFSLCGGVTITNGSLTWQEDSNVILKQVIAPTFSQAFRWFREKYGLYSWVTMELGATLTFCWTITGENKGTEYKAFLKTHEEAELECLKKLIKIVKDGQQMNIKCDNVIYPNSN